MPYRKSYGKRRKRRARPITYGQIGTKIYKDVAALRALINVEFFNAATVFTVGPSSSGAVVNLTQIAQGDNINSRQGNKVRLKHIKCAGVVTLHASATDSRVRMLIVRDNNGSTAQPAITDLFGTVAIFAANQPKLGDAQANSRFSVLWDRMVIMDAGHGLTQQFSMSQTLDHHCFFTGSATTDEGKGALYLFIASNEATNDPIVNASSNVKYIDN